MRDESELCCRSWLLVLWWPHTEFVVRTVEEQLRAAAEHKLGVANQSITAGFFDNNTSVEDRREYLESLLRECKKEEATPVLDDNALNDLLAHRIKIVIEMMQKYITTDVTSIVTLPVIIFKSMTMLQKMAEQNEMIALQKEQEDLDEAKH